MKLERLTQRKVDAALRDGGSKAAAYYELAKQGYLPAEIAVYGGYANDIRSTVSMHARKRGLPLPATCAPSREIVRKVPDITDWRAAFRGTIMRTGMALNLTQPMLEYLCAVADDVQWDRGRYFQQMGAAAPDCGLMTASALVKRGLIMLKRAAVHGSHRYELTAAGQAVVQLLTVAGVFVKADAALSKRA
jgi:hypothetical protein